MKKFSCVIDELMNWWKKFSCVIDELMNWWKKFSCAIWWIDELMNKIDELMKKCKCVIWWIDELMNFLMNWWSVILKIDELMKNLPKHMIFGQFLKIVAFTKFRKIQRFLNISTYCSENKAVREICIFVRETGITRPVYMVPEDAPDNNSLNLYWFGCLHSFLTKTVFMCSVMLVFAHLEVCKCFCQASFPHARTFC